jgi:SAM-dependent methyltransferase
MLLVRFDARKSLLWLLVLSVLHALVTKSRNSTGNTFVEAFVPFFGTSKVQGYQTPFGLSMKAMVSKVLQNPKWPDTWPYTEQDFQRMDNTVDTIFYSEPRLVYHIDDPCRAALTQYYSEVFQPDMDILDICSSWVCHYPTNVPFKSVVGLGMNEYELKQNPILSKYVVQDLNTDPTLPFETQSFDIVTCCVSFDYLNKPLDVMKEVGRVLRPGGQAIISISNRCFPTKAFQLWLQTNDLEHVFIIGSFFHYTNLFEPPSSEDRSPNPGRSDPLYIIKAIRKNE